MQHSLTMKTNNTDIVKRQISVLDKALDGIGLFNRQLPTRLSKDIGFSAMELPTTCLINRFTQ